MHRPGSTSIHVRVRDEVESLGRRGIDVSLDSGEVEDVEVSFDTGFVLIQQLQERCLVWDQDTSFRSRDPLEGVGIDLHRSCELRRRRLVTSTTTMIVTRGRKQGEEPYQEKKSTVHDRPLPGLLPL